MLIVLAERLAQILDWLKTVAGYKIVESDWKVLNSTTPNSHPQSNGGSHRRSYSISSADVFAATQLDDWIPSKDKEQVLRLTRNLSAGSIHEDLCQSLVAIDGQDVVLMGISYSEAQLLSSTLPRCKRYRLCKAHNVSDTEPLQQRTLYFSRHGESVYNVLGRVGGDADLSPRGFLYASKLADYVNRNLLNEAPHFRLWTSCLKRTIQTACGVQAPQEHLPELNELDTGVCDGLTYEEIAERYPAEFAARDDDKFLYRYPEGESYHDLLERVRPVLDRLQTETNVMVIAHQAVIRCLLAVLLNKDTEELPYIHAPLHTIMKLTFHADGQPAVELIPLSVECVDTHRQKPQNCSRARSVEEALVTVPAHY